MRRRWLWVLLLVPLALVLGFTGWAVAGSARNAPAAVAEAALVSDAEVTVALEPWLSFRPVNSTPTIGFIIYPGGLVPPEAYAPAARAIAAAGYFVVITPAPLNLAVIAPDAAAEVIATYPDIERWAIGGHSLGGAMAARYAYENPDAVDGLVLWASFQAQNNDLSDRDLAVTSIYGTNDGLSTPEEVQASAQLLPPDARLVPIEGGNHSQFGAYGDGPQNRDNPATISFVEQQAQIVAATVELLQQLE